MKKILLILLTLGTMQTSFSQQESAFGDGEWFKFKMSYSNWLKAGEATLTVKESKLNNKDVYHVVGKGKTTGMIKWFFKVKDRYESYFDKQTIMPYKFVRNIDEGGHKKDIEIEFDQKNNKAHVNNKKHKTKKTIDTKPNIQDMVSTYYYLRNNINISTLKIGDEIKVDMFFDEENYGFKLKYLGEETIKTDFELLTSPPAKYASASGLQLSLETDSANVATPGSSISYRGVVVGQVDNVTFDKVADKVRINVTIDDEHKSLIRADTRFYNASGVTLSGGLGDFVVKTESVDAILRGGISFYNPKNSDKPQAAVKELDSFALFEHFEQAENAGLAISIHFNDYTGLTDTTKVMYQEQEVGAVTRLTFNEDKVGVTALVLLNDKGAKFAKQGTQFWVVEPEIGLVGSKNITSLNCFLG